MPASKPTMIDRPGERMARSWGWLRGRACPPALLDGPEGILAQLSYSWQRGAGLLTPSPPPAPASAPPSSRCPPSPVCDSPLGQYRVNCLLDAIGGFSLAEVAQQVDGGQEQRQRVGPVHADGLAAAAVEGLVDPDAVAEVDARSWPTPPTRPAPRSLTRSP